MASLSLNSNTASKDIFPFFQLPQELCDQIFEESLVDITFQLKCKLHLKAEDTVATNLLLVSKNFKEQYEARARGKAKLTILDDKRFGPHENHSLQLPAAATKTCMLYINLRSMHQHLWWMQCILPQMPLLFNMSVIMLVRCPKTIRCPIEKLRSYGYQNLLQLRSFEFYDDDRKKKFRPFDLEHGTMRGRYCPERREFLRIVDGVEQPRVEHDMGDLIDLS